jgi:hypothetical protein
VISAIGKLWQEDFKFKASLGYIARAYMGVVEGEKENTQNHFWVLCRRSLVCFVFGITKSVTIKHFISALCY